MYLTDLPDDLFNLIIAHLAPKDVIRNRRVSKDFNTAFTNPELCRQLLIQHYPRAREYRLHHPNAQSSNIPWADILCKVSSRYHHLSLGTPQALETLPLAKSFILPIWSRNYPVAPWQRHLRFEEKTAPFHYPDTLWTYDDGLLIFPSVDLKQYVLYDLEARSLAGIDIESEKKVVRRIRLKGKLLVIEWSEQQPYHQLNESESVYRHFATAYDISLDSLTKKWTTVFRNEWKIHFLGLPLNSRDRFFSTHNDTHYAIYLWQPNRSAWGEDEPIEALNVWDISSLSPYRPSEDPTGASKPNDTLEGPQVIMRFSFSDLDFYGIRQRETPDLAGLELDEANVYIVEESHRWMAGEQACYVLPRLHEVITIGIPFTGGPRWENSCGVDGDDCLSYCRTSSEFKHARLAPCWRHEEFPYLTITEAVDAEAGVSFSARQCFVMETIAISVQPRYNEPGQDLLLKDEFWHLLLAQGKICGDERWLIGENHNNEVVILHFDRRSKQDWDSTDQCT